MNNFDLFKDFESPTANLDIGFNQNFTPLAFRANVLSTLPLPAFLAAIVVTGARLEVPKSKIKQLTIPKNKSVFVELPSTKGAFDVYLLPPEVNIMLTKYAQKYFSYQFTIKLIQYIKTRIVM